MFAYICQYSDASANRRASFPTDSWEVAVSPQVVWVLGQVTAYPTSSGMPGADLIQKLLNWLTQVALWGSLASILVGAAAWGLSQNMGAYANAYRGKQLALAGVAGACLAGVAPTAVNLLFRAAGG